MRPRAPGGPRAAVELLLVAGLGALQTLALVATWVWWLPVLTVAALVWRVSVAAGVRRAALLGWAYGWAWLVATVWWLFISMHRYGHLAAWLAALAVALLAAALALYVALATAAFRRWRRGASTDAVLFAGLWLAAELARGVIFTGFPWGASGYSQVDSPVATLAPWVGVYGMGAVLAAMAAALVPTAGAERRAAWLVRPAGVAAVLALLAWAGPGEHTEPGQTLRVQLLQPNVAQDEKFAAQHMPGTLAWVAQALLASRADLVVAPETAVPLLPDQLEDFSPGYWAALRERFRRGEQAALVGVPLGGYDTGYTNSVVGLSRQAAELPGGQYRYDKAHLVPFGEFIPTGFRWFTELMRIPLGDFARGGLDQPPLALGGERAAPNICYEDLFGEELARRFVDPARAPTLFVNVSNIGWFGDTVAVAQHLNISRLRALEFQRPMLRATNTGATAVIDHLGRVRAQLPPFQRGVLDGEVQGRHGLTPFARWAARAGLWPLWALAGIAIVLGIWHRARA